MTTYSLASQTDLDALTAQVVAVTAQVGTLATQVTALASQVSALTIPPPVILPPPAFWPNEPTGLTLLTDYPFLDPIPALSADLAIGNGWHSIYNGAGNVALVSGSGAPTAPANILQLKYPVGFAGGSAPGTVYYNLPSVHRLYVGFWWKPSSPWQGHPSNVNKVGFVLGGGGEMPLVLYGPPGGPYELKFEPEFGSSFWLEPSVHVPVTLGVWHQVELLLDANAGTADWWLDGQQLGHGAVPYGGPFTLWNFSATWGGIGSAKTETDFFWYDHAHLSGA